MAEDYSWLPYPPKKQQSTDGGPQLTGSQPREELVDLYRSVIGMEPVEAARVLRYASLTDADPESIRAMGKLTAEDYAAMPVGAYWKWVKENRPVTYQYISDPNQMASVKDILDELNHREGFFAQVGRGWSLGRKNVQSSEMAWEQMKYVLTTGQMPTFYERELQQLEREMEAKSAPGGVGFNVAQQLPQYGLIAKRGGFWAAVGGIMGAAAGLIGGQLGPQVATPEELVTVPALGLAGMKLGAAVGGKVGAMEAMVILEGGSAFREFIKIKDKQGNPIDPRLAAYGALAVGLANAGLEYVGFEALLGTIPGVKEALGNIAKRMPKGVSMVAKGAKEYVKNILTEMATEYAQETVTQLGGEAIKGIAPGEFERVPAKEMFARSAGVIVPTLQTTAVFGFPGLGAHVFQAVVKTSQAQTEAEIYKAAGKDAAQSQHLERLPEGFREHVTASLAGGNETVYLQAEPLLQLIQENAEKSGLIVDEAVRIAAYELNLDPNQLQEAAAAGQSVAVPFGLWLEKTARTPAYAAMEEHARFSEDGITLAQAKIEEVRIQELVDQEQQRAQAIIAENQKVQTGYDLVYADVQQKLLAAGRPQGISEKSWGKYVDNAARLWAAHAVTEAARRQIAVEEWYAGPQYLREVREGEGAPVTAAQEAQEFAQAALHVSTADFDRFSTAFIGTGVGQSLKGWGINFTTRRELVEHYKRLFKEYRGKESVVYKVEIPENNELLNFDVTLAEQPVKVQRALEKIIRENPDLEALGNPTGLELYQALSVKLGGNKEASLYLRDHGIPGDLYKVATPYGEMTNFVVYDEEAMKILEKEYAQGERGFVSITPEGSIISLLASADASTFLHESAHLWLEDMFEYSKTGGATEEFMRGWAPLVEFLGIKEGQESLTVEQQEKFAQAFEAYLMEGKAPSKGLRRAFAAFRRWLLRIYQVAAGLGVEINDDVRQSLDRMLATEEQIREAELLAAQNERLISEEEVAPEIWAFLDEYREQAHEEAFSTLMKRQMEELTEERQKQRAEEETKARAQIEEAMAGEPVFAAQRDIQDRIGEDVRTAANQYREGTLAEEAQAAFEAIAEENGFSSGDELVQSILAGRTWNEELQARLAQRMEESAGLLSPANLREVAAEAIRNQHSEELIAMETAILQDLIAKEQGKINRKAALERAKIMTRAAKARAKKLMEGKRYTEATAVTVYFKAERDAAVKAAQAAAKGDKEAAARFAEQRMINHALAMEALKARNEVDKIFRLIKKYQKRGRSLMNMPAEFVKQIDAILQRFGLGQGPVLEPGETIETLNEFAKRMEEEYHALPISDVMLSGYQKSYTELTMGELRDLYNTVKCLGTLGRKWKQFLNDFVKADVLAAATEIRRSIEENVGKPRAGEKEIGGKTRLQKLLGIGDELTGWLVKPEFVARFLDGGKDGPMQKYLIQLLSRAWAAERNMEQRVIGELRGLVGQFYTEKEMAAMSRDEVFIPEIDKSLTREEIIWCALYWGHEEGRQRIMGGFNLTEEQVGAILDQLTEKDVGLINGIWDYLETFWPEVKALEEEVAGVTPEKVEAAPYDVRAGHLKGGYAPIAYDPGKSTQAAKSSEQLNALYKEMPAARTMTRHGHTKKRAKLVNRPPLLSWSVLTTHLVNVTHDLTHRKVIIDANRILKNKEVRTAIEDSLGIKGYRALENAIKAIASDQGESMDFADRAFRWLRSRTTLYAMGFNLRVALLQISGVIQGAWEIGAIPTMRGIANFAMNPAQTWNTVREKSVFLRDRAQVMDRDIYDFSRRMFKGDNKMMNFAYSLMAYMDQAWCVPIWMESYRMALAEGLTEDQAIERADGAVRRAAGSGAVKDLAAVQRGPEMKKAISMFYSFGSLLFNRYWLSMKRAGVQFRKGDIKGGSKEIAGLVFYGWILPGVFEFALREVVRRKDDDEPDEAFKRFLAAMTSWPLQTIPLVRDAGTYLTNKVFGQGYTSGFRITPLESSIEDAVRTVDRGVRAMKGEGEWTDAAESAAKSGAFMGGIPQIVVNWVFNAMDWFKEFGEADWRDLFSRKPKE